MYILKTYYGNSIVILPFYKAGKRLNKDKLKDSHPPTNIAEEWKIVLKSFPLKKGKVYRYAISIIHTFFKKGDEGEKHLL